MHNLYLLFSAPAFLAARRLRYLAVGLSGLFLAVFSLTGYAQPQTEVFTKPNSYTFTAPPNVTKITVELWGGGGIGGGSPAIKGVSNATNGGGGGGGAYIKALVDVVPGNTYSFSVGAGGTPSNPDGSPSTFTKILQAGGGKAGAVDQGGEGGSIFTNGLKAITFRGGDGASNGEYSKEVYPKETRSFSGGGGSSAGFKQEGNSGNYDKGGLAPTGGGAGGNGINLPTDQKGDGQNGGLPSGGGGGSLAGTPGLGAPGQVIITYTIPCPTIYVTAPGTTSVQTGTDFSQSFTQKGGEGTVTFSLASGSLPTGLTLHPSGLLSGTPTQTGSFPITVQATDANLCTGTSATYTLEVKAPPGITSAIVSMPSSVSLADNLQISISDMKDQYGNSFTPSNLTVTYTHLNQTSSSDQFNSLTSPFQISKTFSTPGTYKVNFDFDNGNLTVIKGIEVLQSATALNFDGQDDYINLGSNSAFKFTGSFTVEAWIYPTAAVDGIIVNKEGEYEFGRLPNGTLQYAIANNASGGWAWRNTGLVVPLNTWAHVSLSYDRSTNTVTVTKDNDTKTITETGDIGDVHTQWNDLRIGGRQGFVQPFKGDIDEVRIWNRAVCLGEIRNNRSGELPLPQAGLVGYYKLNQGYVHSNNADISTVNDASGNGRNGTLFNFAKTGTTSNWTVGTVIGTVAAFVVPTVAAGSNSPVVYGQSLNLTASGTDGTYRWSGPKSFISAGQNPVLSPVQLDNAGTYTVTRTVEGCTSTTTTEVTVEKAPLTITANNQTKECGQELNLGSSGFTVEGLVGDDRVTSITLSSEGAPSTSSTGNYPIVASKAVGSGLENYIITYADGKLEVEDITPPVAKAKGVILTLKNGQATLTAADLNDGSSDNCTPQDQLRLSVSKTSFDCNTLGQQQVTLTVTDAAGLSNQAIATVTVVGEKPAVSISLSPQSTTYTGAPASTIFLGYGSQSVTLSASDASPATGTTYAWSPVTALSSATGPSTVFAPTVAGAYKYTVTATNQYGCTASASQTLTVIDVRCGNKGDKVQLCHNGKEQCVAPSAVEAFLKKGQKLGSCGSANARTAAPEEVAIDLTEQPVTELTVTVGPNPTSERFEVSIRLPQPTEVVLQLRDLRGQLMQTQKVPAAGTQLRQEVSLGTYPQGLYLMSVQTATEQRTIKVVKQ